MQKGALEGLRILDLSRVLAGPFCSMMLADMGAEVIKIEQPGIGDDSRQFAPMKSGESSYYMNLNRNKKGITLNLKGKGRDIFLEMVKQADIVLENYRPGTMEKLGLGYEALKTVNPRIIYGAISGFGHTGRNKMRPGYDIIAQATGGLMSTTGWPGGEPTRSGTAMGDVLAGLSLAIGLLAAVNHQTRTGQGQKVDIALVDSVVASMEIINQIYLVEGRLPERIGNRYESCYPYDSFAAKDGWLVIGAANDKLWHLVCKVIGREDLIQNPRYKTNPDRVKNHAEIKPLVEAWTKQYPAEDVINAMLAAGVPAAPINTIDQIVNDPHIAQDRQMFVDVMHPLAGKTTLTGSHLKFSLTQTGIRTAAPLLGEHNTDIYQALLGYTPEVLSELKDSGVI
ncbi:CoA transferase [Testudinibacter sp. TR-2022]|uniref:CaiB/BaiF CoA transferase family protein n=1 Tax=Testudinibacter sp. TR-2022 TaxID=2585029 RepID=UPI00111B27D2|nr:CoA transferase [Testudinibacter sp. TR-2022]TNH05078.1 CoA transferase [Pasteurellaceae bacterium Phil31]TNH08978.1 CoA transferase [Testudinibacter sp. TR-2022]TNH10655.1 CoA transferase [Testudinibacter sp. TR-2022]TNH17197.1 CoA transferase [Testudinibacter sp. TR-2022]TNH20759.1 CoA transferase [Testudinibacter sp. TR-2022]